MDLQNKNSDSIDGSSVQIGEPSDATNPESTSGSSSFIPNPVDVDDNSPSEDLFEVEKIIGHKVEKGIDYWKVRWVGYGPNDDTWEPRENFLDDKVKKMLDDYEAVREATKKKRAETLRKKKEGRRTLEQQEATTRDVPIPTEDAVINEQGQPDESNTSWYGIKADEGSREERRLFVPDRRLSKTEKLLTEIGTSHGERILRKHLKEQSVDRQDTSKGSSLSPLRRIMKPKTRKTPTKVAKSDVFTCESPQKNKEVEIKSELEQMRELKPKVEELKSKEEKTQTKTVPYEHTKSVEMKKQPQKTTVKKGDDGLGAFPSFGVSKGLKSPKKVVRRKPSVEEKHKKVKNEGKELGATESVKKEKRKKLKLTSTRETGLPLCVCPAGSSTAAAIEYLTAKNASTTEHNTLMSQEQFEEVVMDGKVEKVKAVLNNENNALDLNHVDDVGKTLMHKLCEVKCGVSHTQCELIDLLVSHGARLNIRDGSHNQIPLHIAIANRRLCHVRKLLELQSPVNYIDKSGKSPLILALDCSDFEFMKCLLKAGASFHPAQEKLYEDGDQNKRQNRLITEHESQLRKALNSARDNVASNMAVKCISPIFVNPLHESKSVHTFHLKSQPKLPAEGEHAYVLLASVAEFLPDEKEACCEVEARMWGQSPLLRVIMNGKQCNALKTGNKFAFLCVPCQGQNHFELALDPNVRDSRLMLLSQVVLAQLIRPTSYGNSRSTAPNRK